MPRVARPALLIAALLTVGAARASAQSSSTVVSAESSSLSADDSVAFARAARSDQASFERFRRGHLPETWGGGSSRCDERVGRFCLTHGDRYDEWVPPPEDEQIIAERARLVDGLGQVAALLPGDGWVAGQLVRYLLEARRFDSALTAARRCQAEPWWCAALTGFVLHYTGTAAAADSAFAVALAAMDDEQRASWTDLSLILADPTVRRYRRMSPEEKTVFERRFWRFADPLLIRPGNGLRAEHFARHVWDRLQYEAEVTDGVSWGYDLREIVIRYGWPSGWERTRQWRAGSASIRPPLISHYGSAPHYLLPPPESLLDGNGTDGDWEADLPRARTGYSISIRDSIADWFAPVAHQIAVFRRGDRALIVVGYELPADSIADGATVTAGLAALPTRGPEAKPEVAITEGANSAGALLLSIPAEPVIASLELLIPDDRHVARARHGLDISPVDPGLVSLSDILLLSRDSTTEALPDSLAAAIEVVRPSNRVRPGESIGAYWEIHGLNPERTATVAMSLRLLEERKGWLRRIAERAGILDDAAPIRLRWEEPTTPGDYMARSIAIEIPELSPGTYTLELTIEAPGREPLSVQRDLEIADG